MTANFDIKSAHIILIDSQGRRLGEFITREAIQRANDEGFDLIQVTDGAIPTAKMGDLGKMLYDKKKAEKTKSHKVETKEVKITPRTDIGDLKTKAAQAQKFLDKGNIVKFCVHLSGREATLPQVYLEKIETFKSLLTGFKEEGRPSVAPKEYSITLVQEK